MILVYILVSLVIGYLLGSIPTGVVLVRLNKGRKIPYLGNTRPGAANVLREIGRAFGVAVGLLDLAKGAAAALAVTLLGFPEYCAIAACVAAIAGHNWSLFLSFKGGEGVAVTMGAGFYYYPPVQFILYGVYFLFYGLWALEMRPFYRYHAFNWQAVFCCAPVVLYLCGERCVMGYAGISFGTALLLSCAMALAGLAKQIELYGVSYLFKPSDSGEKDSGRLEGAP